MYNRFTLEVLNVSTEQTRTHKSELVRSIISGGGVSLRGPWEAILGGGREGGGEEEGGEGGVHGDRAFQVAVGRRGTVIIIIIIIIRSSSSSSSSSSTVISISISIIISISISISVSISISSSVSVSISISISIVCITKGSPVAKRVRLAIEDGRPRGYQDALQKT